MMNPDDKIAWIAALRSGEFKQDEGYLRTDDGFCCLGVLCHLKEVPFDKVKDDISPEYEEYQFTFADGSKFIGSVSEGFCGLELTDQEKLIDLNDTQGKTFAEIADYIEANL